MEFRNLKPFDVVWFSALDQHDIERPVIVMKVGYRLQSIADRPGYFTAEVMDEAPLQLCTSDRHAGMEGKNSVFEERDMAQLKLVLSTK